MSYLLLDMLVFGGALLIAFTGLAYVRKIERDLDREFPPRPGER